MFYDFLSAPHFLEYQGSFQSCFHFADSYRTEQTIGGVHVPGDAHTYTSHQHNGFHMSTSNTSSAGDAPRLQHPSGRLTGFQWIIQTPRHCVSFRLQLDSRAARRSRVSVLLGPGGQRFLPGGQLWTQPEPHLVHIHRDIEPHWSRARFTTPPSLLRCLKRSRCTFTHLDHFSSSSPFPLSHIR